jgi:hypothetical protein
MYMTKQTSYTYNMVPQCRQFFSHFQSHPFANPSSTKAMGMKKPAPRLKSPTKNAIEPGSAIEPEEADATVTAEPAGTEAADS